METVASSESKTPISSVQEMCTKWGIIPQYELINCNGPVHEPVFEYRVVAGEHLATGKGSSKKKAKHKAAESLMSLIKSTMNGSACTTSSVSLCEADSASCDSYQNKSLDNNAISYLQELTQKRRWPSPLYECTNEYGPPHARQYMITVHLGSLTETGIGPSKKIAKKNAALALVRRLEAAADMVGEGEGSNGFNEANVTFDPDLVATMEELKLGVQKLDTLNPLASQQINKFYSALKSKTGKTLASLQSLSLNVPATNYCQLLAEIAEEQSFTATYVNLPERTTDGKCQCLVQLSVMPVAVCHGLGRTVEDAHLDAAHNALQYLKIMTRKT